MDMAAIKVLPYLMSLKGLIAMPILLVEFCSIDKRAEPFMLEYVAGLNSKASPMIIITIAKTTSKNPDNSVMLSNPLFLLNIQ
jgi:hypothetical protein